MTNTKTSFLLDLLFLCLSFPLISSAFKRFASGVFTNLQNNGEDEKVKDSMKYSVTTEVCRSLLTVVYHECH